MTSSSARGIYGHIGDLSPDYLTIPQTLTIGLRNYEHIAAIPSAIIQSAADKSQVEKQFKTHFGEMDTEAKYLEFFLEQFRFVKENKLPELEVFIAELALKKATFCSTIHRLYEQFHPTYYSLPNDTSLSLAQTNRCLESFQIMMQCMKMMQDKGLEIRLGSDGANGGRINISELILLCKYGFSVADAFKIATINGAKAMKIEDQVGSLETGKQVNLLIWDKDPFADYTNFSLGKTIIKDGQILNKAMW
ncbi:amidohydrolase family protein [Pedobacter gandavensis]|uniref:amidohydrolase family protein n=1 Tax=Pedobacter gandavensis TaxID=2679963 RepID=UPI00292EC525|nr:amidohydrolase family protein [Pedobacter gandavensis]